jgi:hypothetical protein
MSKSLESVLIERAIALIESGWTQNAMARDMQGRIVCPRSKRAVSFCGYGALMRAAWEVGGNSSNYRTFMRRLTVFFPVLDLVRFNDGGTRTAVVGRMREILATTR